MAVQSETLPPLVNLAVLPVLDSWKLASVQTKISPMSLSNIVTVLAS